MQENLDETRPRKVTATEPTPSLEQAKSSLSLEQQTVLTSLVDLFASKISILAQWHARSNRHNPISFSEVAKQLDAQQSAHTRQFEQAIRRLRSLNKQGVIPKDIRDFFASELANKLTEKNVPQEYWPKNLAGFFVASNTEVTQRESKRRVKKIIAGIAAGITTCMVGAGTVFFASKTMFRHEQKTLPKDPTTVASFHPELTPTPLPPTATTEPTHIPDPTKTPTPTETQPPVETASPESRALEGYLDAINFDGFGPLVMIPLDANGLPLGAEQAGSITNQFDQFDNNDSITYTKTSDANTTITVNRDYSDVTEGIADARAYVEIHASTYGEELKHILNAIEVTVIKISSDTIRVTIKTGNSNITSNPWYEGENISHDIKLEDLSAAGGVLAVVISDNQAKDKVIVTFRFDGQKVVAEGFVAEE